MPEALPATVLARLLLFARSGMADFYCTQMPGITAAVAGGGAWFNAAAVGGAIARGAGVGGALSSIGSLFHKSSPPPSTSTTTQTGTPGTTTTTAQTGTPSTTATTANTGLPASVSQAGAVDTSAASAKNTPRSDLPRDSAGNYLPDPNAQGAHSVIGTRVGSDGVPYRQAATFDEKGKFEGRTDVTDHGRADHVDPHFHPAKAPNSVEAGAGKPVDTSK